MRIKKILVVSVPIRNPENGKIIIDVGTPINRQVIEFALTFGVDNIQSVLWIKKG